MSTLNEVPISMVEYIVPIGFLVSEETPCNLLIGLLTMIQLHARPDYFRMVLKIHNIRDSEILNYEYERDNGNTSEDEFTTDSADEDEHKIVDAVQELVLMFNEPEKKTESSDEDQLLYENLSYLNMKDVETVRQILRDYPEVVANSFEDVRPSTVSVTHPF